MPSVASPFLCTVLLALIAAGTAGAQEDAEAPVQEEAVPVQDEAAPDQYAEPGAYATGLAVGAFLMSSESDFAEEFFTGRQRRADVDPTAGLDVRLGYRWTDRLAVEGGFLWLTNRDYHSQDVTTGQRNEARARSWSLTGQLKYFLLTRRIQPYLSFGGGWSEVSSKAGGGPQRLIDRKDTEEGAVGRLAAGVDVYLDRHLAATLEAGTLMGAGPLSQMDQLLLAFGFTLRF